MDQQDDLEDLNVSSKQGDPVEQVITKYLGECLSTPESFRQLNNIINSASLLSINYKPLNTEVNIRRAKFYYLKESKTYTYESLPNKLKDIAIQNFEKFNNGSCAVYIEWLQAEDFDIQVLQITSHNDILPCDYLILNFHYLQLISLVWFLC